MKLYAPQSTLIITLMSYDRDFCAVFVLFGCAIMLEGKLHTPKSSEVPVSIDVMLCVSVCLSVRPSVCLIMSACCICIYTYLYIPCFYIHTYIRTYMCIHANTCYSLQVFAVLGFAGVFGNQVSSLFTSFIYTHDQTLIPPQLFYTLGVHFVGSNVTVIINVSQYTLLLKCSYHQDYYCCCISKCSQSGVQCSPSSLALRAFHHSTRYALLCTLHYK